MATYTVIIAALLYTSKHSRGKLLRFINNVHYVGKIFAVCSLCGRPVFFSGSISIDRHIFTSFFLRRKFFQICLFPSTYHTFFQWILWKVFQELYNSINNSVINSISCYNGLLFRPSKTAVTSLLAFSMAELLKCWCNEPEG